MLIPSWFGRCPGTSLGASVFHRQRVFLVRIHNRDGSQEVCLVWELLVLVDLKPALGSGIVEEVVVHGEGWLMGPHTTQAEPPGLRGAFGVPQYSVHRKSYG